MLNQPKSTQQLELISQHKAELTALLAVETQSWQALDVKHQLVITRLRLVDDSWNQQLTALKAQLIEILSLHQTNQENRSTLQRHQSKQTITSLGYDPNRVL